MALTANSLNIRDAYFDERFDKSNDERTGFKTKTILAVPILNMVGEVQGVIQAINKKPDEEGNQAQVREGLHKLARRAFRRPVGEDELNVYHEIVKAELAAGEKFADAVKAGMLAILCSKSFIFLAEGDEELNRNTLNDWEIASRLSYLFWSTMPDDQLFELAEQGKLHDQAELSRQVQRMLADPKADRFSESFSAQWLHLRKVGQFPPDRKLYPDYDKSLEKSMVSDVRPNTTLDPILSVHSVGTSRILKPARLMA